jgi:hypothetical protein
MDAVLRNHGPCAVRYTLVAEAVGGDLRLDGVWTGGPVTVDPYRSTPVGIGVQVSAEALPGSAVIELLAISESGGTCAQRQTQICAASATVTVPDDYAVLELSYKTFIRCSFIQASWPSPTWPFYSGDSRVFGEVGSSRTYQTVQATVDPRGGGIIGIPVEGNGISNGYITLHDNNPIITEWCDIVCRFTTFPGQQPNCSGFGPRDFRVTPERVSSGEVAVLFEIFARPGCSMPVLSPSIDAHFEVHVRQPCIDGVLQSPQLRFSAYMDAFPWHEFSVNGGTYRLVDPCAMLSDGRALLPPDDDIQVSFPWVQVPP